MKQTRYKPVGWERESHRHSLAARGIASSYFSKRGTRRDVIARSLFGPGPSQIAPKSRVIKGTSDPEALVERFKSVDLARRDPESFEQLRNSKEKVKEINEKFARVREVRSEIRPLQRQLRMLREEREIAVNSMNPVRLREVDEKMESAKKSLEQARGKLTPEEKALLASTAFLSAARRAELKMISDIEARMLPRSKAVDDVSKFIGKSVAAENREARERQAKLAAFRETLKVRVAEEKLTPEGRAEMSAKAVESLDLGASVFRPKARMESLTTGKGGRETKQPRVFRETEFEKQQKAELKVMSKAAAKVAREKTMSEKETEAEFMEKMSRKG